MDSRADMAIELKKFGEQFERLSIVYCVIRFAFDELSNQARQRFIKMLRNEREEQHKMSLDFLKEIIGDAPEIFEDFAKAQRKELKRRFRKGNTTQYYEWVEDGMRCSELSARFTIFED